MKADTLIKQYEKTKKELLKLYTLLSDKPEEMIDHDAPAYEIRRIINNTERVKTILVNDFDFHKMESNNQIEIACKIGDKYHAN